MCHSRRAGLVGPRMPRAELSRSHCWELFSPHFLEAGSQPDNKSQEVVIRFWANALVPTLLSSGSGSKRGQSTFLTGSAVLFWGKGQAVTQAQTWHEPPRVCFEFASLILPFAQIIQGTLLPSVLAVQASVAGGGLRRANQTSHSCPHQLLKYFWESGPH